MSEHAPRNHESSEHKSERVEVRRSPEHKAKTPETDKSLTAEQARENLESIRHDVAEKAISKEDVVIDKSEKSTSDTAQPLINKELKSVMLTRTLSRIQKQLKPAERTFSKVIHSKPVDKISSVSEKTVARPYGILGGALLAFLGSIFSTYLSKQFGINYNLLLFVMLFATGYVLATILEGLARLVIRAK